jgi:hypothetical protein
MAEKVTVKSGQTLSSIAKANNTTVAAIKEAILNSTSYEVDYSLSSEFKKSIKPYSLIIFHGALTNQNTIINDCKINSIPFWIINPLSAENLSGVKINSAIMPNYLISSATMDMSLSGDFSIGKFLPSITDYNFLGYIGELIIFKKASL